MSYRWWHKLTDASDTSDSAWNDFGENDLAAYRPWQPAPDSVHTSQAGAEAPPPTPVQLPDETAEAKAALAGSGTGGVGSVVAQTSGGLTINLIFDAAAMAAPASFRAGIQQAAALLSAAISDKITLNFNIDYSGTGGGAAAGPDGGQWVSYSTVRADLVNYASAGDSTFNVLPTGSTIQGQSNVAVWNTQLKLWGLLGANDTTTDDASATFTTDISSGLLVGVALHELTHAMGRVPYGPQPDIFDLFRFTNPGARLFSNSIPASAAYFSLNGGITKLADYGQSSDPSDLLNSGVQGSADPFNEYYSGATLQHLTSVDLQQLDALGYHLTSATPIVIQTDVTTSLVQIGSSYFLDAVSSGTGPQLKSGGSAVSAGAFGGWAPIGAVQTASGYDVAWKLAGADQYSVWAVDTNGNFVSSLTPNVSAFSAVLENFETIFHQDFNGDGILGPIVRTIQVDGSTSLTEVGNNYFLYVGGTGPSLKSAGMSLSDGQFGGWTPIGAIQTSSGYDVAWKLAGADQYGIWAVDTNGNFVSSLTPNVSAFSTILENFETTFQQDFNGDGHLGPTLRTIQVDGSTSLTEVGNNYFLYVGGSGPSLKSAGLPVSDGQFGGWAPIGAIQTASGYDVAWKLAGADQYSVWALDTNGNFVSCLTPNVSALSFTLESFETVFHQDFNGDGTLGPVARTIQVDGATSLTEVGNNYFLYVGGVGPTLKSAGLPISDGQFGGWAPIGAIQTASGYDVAWKLAGADQYSIWAVDTNGNFVSSLTPNVSALSTTLESFETVFHQDFNGDGILGIPASHTSGVQAGQPAFDGTILTLETPSTFTGELAGFSGNGNLPNSDQIDLRGFNFGSFQASVDSPTGTLTATSGSNVASLHFLGLYSQSNFHFADDGQGGTLIIAASPAQPASPSQISAGAAHDTFVFAQGFGNVALANFTPATDTLQFGKSVFTDITALLAATHDDQAGNAVITDAAHDTITLQHVATAQLLSHQSAFHFV